MAISIFPSTAAEFVSNNFVIDMNDTSNNTADTGGVKQAGPYSISFSSGDTSFDVYLIDEDGNSVGYSNNTSIVASGLFTTVVILGVAQDEIISFLYQGSVNNADGEGDEPGAGAYLDSISPSDLPSIDDTATVTGGNFGADTEITFESGATVLPAKSITVVSGTELLVTRPDGLIEDDAPYDLKAVNTGVTPPSSINFVLTDAVTAGSDPTWVTGTNLTAATINVAYSETLEATDDGAVTDYSVTSGALPTGLSLDSSTGVISGTPTGSGQTFTVTATDDVGNTTPKEFNLPVIVATGGNVTSGGGFVYHTFTSTDDFEALAQITNAEYLVIAGGGAGGTNADGRGSGGGGAGGVLSGTETFSVGTTTITIGAGGSGNGSDSSLGSLAIATGGGKGGNGRDFPDDGENGSSGGSGGGGGGDEGSAGNGIVGQGNDGGDADQGGGGGGGKGSDGGNATTSGGSGGAGTDAFSAFASATSTGDNGFFASGGAGGDSGGVFATNPTAPDGGGGDGGNGSGGDPNGENALANTGGGGGGSAGFGSGGLGGSGIVIVRYI